MAAPSQSIATSSVGPAGYSGLRGAILVELKKSPELSARDLAGRLGVSINAIRHHLKELTGQDVVRYERRTHGVGAPVFAYRLTGAGEDLFPRRYEEALNRVLEQIERQSGREAAVAALEAYFADLARRLEPRLDGADPSERLRIVADQMAAEGYMAEVELVQMGGRLTQHNCAIRAVAERFPEVCAAESRFLAEVLGSPVERQSHILDGCSACAYTTQITPTAVEVERAEEIE